MYLIKHQNIKLLTVSADKIDQLLKGMVVDAIVTEGYLGKALRGQEPLTFLQKQKQEIEEVWRKSLVSWVKILSSGARVVCVWPVFVSSTGTVAVDLKQELSELGYRWVNPLEGWHDKPVTLTYARADQHVKRNIVVLERV